MKGIPTDRILTFHPEQPINRRFAKRQADCGFGSSHTAGFTRALATLLCLGIWITCFAAGCAPGQVAAANGSSVPTMMPEPSDAAAEMVEPVPNQDTIFQNVADMIKLVFEERVNPADMRISDWPQRYAVQVYGKNTDDMIYYAYVDGETGEVEHVSMANYDALPLTDAQRAVAAGYGMRTSKTIVDVVALEWACAPVARELVERAFANGRTILETSLNFSMTDSGMEPRVQVGIDVHMDTGPCYVVTMIWPQLTVSECSINPRGMGTCFYGNQTEQQEPVDRHMFEKAGDAVTFDGISYYYLPIDDRYYNVTPSYRYDLADDDVIVLIDTRLSEAQAWEKAEAALNTLIPEYRDVPGRFVVEEQVQNDGTVSDHPAWRFHLIDRSPAGIQRGQITLWLDRYGNVGKIYVQGRSDAEDRDVDVELKFTPDEMIGLALACMEKNGYDADPSHYEITTDAIEYRGVFGDPLVQWTVTLTGKTSSTDGEPGTFSVTGNGRSGQIYAFWKP